MSLSDGWPPFRRDEERRFLLRSELDAFFFQLYVGPQPEWQQQPEALTRAFPAPRRPRLLPSSERKRRLKFR
jgi:hypothetical protein